MFPFNSAEKQTRNANILLFVASILIAIAVALASIRQLPPFAQLDSFFFDTYLTWHNGKAAPTDKVVIVDIDDVSLSAVGQWPWPRYRIASLLQSIADMGAQVIALDIIFSENDRTALETIRQNFQTDFGLDIQFVGVPDKLTDNDGFLGYVMAQTNTIGANYFYFDHEGGAETCNNNDQFITGRTDLLDLHSATTLLCNTQAISKQLQHRGFINSRLDDDGNLRHLPLLIKYNGKVFPNLSLTALREATGVENVQVISTAYGPAISIGELTIPISKDGFALLPFNGPARTHSTFSAIDIINSTVSPKQVENKIVFVGSSAAGLNDLYHTVFDSRYPGVEAHALLTDSALSGRAIIKPVWTDQIIWAVCLSIGIFTPVLFMLTPGPYLQIGTTCLLLLSILTTSVVSYFYKNIFFSPVSAIILIVLLFVLFACLRYAMLRQLAYDWYRKLARTQQITLESMATVAETRDPDTGAHIKRTQYYVRALAEYLVRAGFYKALLTPEFIELLFISAPLHDIGKVGVPDNILLKPAKLTFEEFEEMKKHAEYGYNIILSTAKKMDDATILEVAGEIAVYHHERWDGKGYPKGISGDTIPLSGRLMAVADVYDALTSQRCYKRAIPHDQAMSIILDGKGSQFDPLIIDAFVTIEERIKDISIQFKD